MSRRKNYSGGGKNNVTHGGHEVKNFFWYVASLAQSVERKALNLVVAGSSPAGGAFLTPASLVYKVVNNFHLLLRACRKEKLKARQKK